MWEATVQLPAARTLSELGTMPASVSVVHRLLPQHLCIGQSCIVIILRMSKLSLGRLNQVQPFLAPEPVLSLTTFHCDQSLET